LAGALEPPVSSSAASRAAVPCSIWVMTQVASQLRRVPCVGGPAWMRSHGSVPSGFGSRWSALVVVAAEHGVAASSRASALSCASPNVIFNAPISMHRCVHSKAAARVKTRSAKQKWNDFRALDDRRAG
jgi:hypothetical protein